MKLKKAIEIVAHVTNHYQLLRDPDLTDALKLVIEAGKKEEGLREGLPSRLIRLLPGETKE